MKIKVTVIYNSCKFSEDTSAFTEMMAVAQETGLLLFLTPQCSQKYQYVLKMHEILLSAIDKMTSQYLQIPMAYCNNDCLFLQNQY